jgi:hypothetical protein
MQLDGLKSSQGPQGPDRGAARKAEPKAGGKSFADALGKAQAGQQPAAAPEAPKPASEPLPEPSMGSHLDMIRFKLQSGYYNDAKVDDALSDKLSGYFDDVA